MDKLNEAGRVKQAMDDSPKVKATVKTLSDAPNIRKFTEDYGAAVKTFLSITTDYIGNNPEDESCAITAYFRDLKGKPENRKAFHDNIDAKVTFMKQNGIEEITPADLTSPDKRAMLAVVKGTITQDNFSKMKQTGQLGEIYRIEAESMLKVASASMAVTKEHLEARLKAAVEISDATPVESIPISIAFVNAVLRRL